MGSVCLYTQNEENKTGSMSWQCCSKLEGHWWGSRRYRNKVHIRSYIFYCVYINTFCGCKDTHVEVLLSEHFTYRVSQEECEILRESVPYVKLYRYNPKHLSPKLNGYRDNGQRKVWTSCISAYCTSTAVAH